MVFFSYFAVSLDEDKHISDFGKAAAAIIPPTEKLVAYKYVPLMIVQYFGRTVPKITDISELNSYYQQGCWIFCTASYVEQLSREKGFRIIYLAEHREKTYDPETTAMALFNNTAPLAGKNRPPCPIP